MHPRPGRYQFYKGTVTKAICTLCDAGYKVAQAGRACCELPGCLRLHLFERLSVCG